MRIAIDLLWLRPGKVGGTEYFIRNLLDGFMNTQEEFFFSLLVSKDNAHTFERYVEDKRFELLKVDIESANIAKRILWQNFFQNKFLREKGITRCFEPVYCKPWLNGGIEYTCVIHDLQAYHYPEYHPLHEVLYSRICWRMDVWNAAQIVAISNWVKKDIEEKYGRKDVRVIYNPITINKEEVSEFNILKNRYGIEKKQFFYTIAQMIPHKNIQTLIRVMDLIVNQNYSLPDKLLITGVNGNAKTELLKLIKEKKLEEHVILTGVIDNSLRNALYQNCAAFVFPSVFEGFGMPPIEAMLFGTKVITTKRTSIPEVTQGKAIYVEDPYDEKEWIECILKDENRCGEMNFNLFQQEEIAKLYLETLQKPIWKKSKGSRNK